MTAWRTLGAFDAARLAAARLQAHHAAQWLARAARAHIMAWPDDGHTNLGWDDAFGGFVTHPHPDGARLGLRIGDLTLVLLGADWRQADRGLRTGGPSRCRRARLAGPPGAAARPRPAAKLDDALPYELPAHPRRCLRRRRPGAQRACDLVQQRQCGPRRDPRADRRTRARSAASALLAAPFRSRHAGDRRARPHHRHRLRAGRRLLRRAVFLCERLSGAGCRNPADAAGDRPLAYDAFHRRGRDGARIVAAKDQGGAVQEFLRAAVDATIKALS